MPLPVTNKFDFYNRFISGEFGNNGTNFSDGWAAYNYAHDNKCEIGIRTKSANGGGPFIPHVTWQTLWSEVKKLNALGYTEDAMQFSVMWPVELHKLQGYVMRDHRGLVLDYSFSKTNMRESMRNHMHATGLKAKMIMQGHMNPEDYEHVMQLLDDYDSHVVEFTSFAHTIGTIIWEVRAY